MFVPSVEVDRFFDELSVLEAACEVGYFDEGLPEDDVCYKLEYTDYGDLTAEEQHLYDTRVLPLLKLFYADRAAFWREYVNRRELADEEPESSAEDIRLQLL